MQKSLSSVLPKRVYPFSMRMHSKSIQRKLASHEKISRSKVSRRSLVTTVKKLTWKEKRTVLSSKKRLQLIAVITPPVINHFPFQSLFRKCKSHDLQSCPKEFIQFLCECVVNLLKGNLQAIKRHHVVNFQVEVWFLLLKKTTWKQRRNVLSSEKALQLLTIITLPIIIHLS